MFYICLGRYLLLCTLFVIVQDFLKNASSFTKSQLVQNWGKVAHLLPAGTSFGNFRYTTIV